MRRHVTERDVSRFTEGDCHVFARALHRATGWPIHAFEDEDEGRPSYHAFVVAPDGRHVDVEGWHEPADHERIWGCEKHREASWGDFKRAGWGLRWGAHSYSRARALAPLVIAAC